jgi:hypothetical protein
MFAGIFALGYEKLGGSRRQNLRLGDFPMWRGSSDTHPVLAAALVRNGLGC